MTENEQFFSDLLESLKQSPALSGAIFTETEVAKNNVTMKGIEIKMPDSVVSPVIYPTEMRECLRPGESVVTAAKRFGREIAKEIRRENEIIQKNIKALSHMQKFPVTAAVVSYEPNKKWLKEIPHERIEDLAVYAKIELGPDSCVKVNTELLSRLHRTKEELLKEAKQNLAKKAVFKSMQDVVLDQLLKKGADPEIAHAIAELETKIPLWILTNQNSYEGAGLIACPEVLKNIYDQIGGEYYVLPSSIHEVIILPKDFPMDVDELKKTVEMVNQDCVKDIDRLSDEVYEFDGKELKLSVCQDLEKNIAAEMPGLPEKNKQISRRSL